MVNPRAEQLVVLPSSPVASYGPSQVWINESPEEGFDETAGTRDLFGAGLAIRGAARGNLDDDAAQEWVGVAIAGTQVSLYLADLQANGSLRTEKLFAFNPGSFEVHDARVELADIDGDSRDELIVVARAWHFGVATNDAVVKVFDDPENGAFELLDYYRSHRHIDLWGLPADVDGDGRPEVVVSLAGDTTNDGRHAIRLYDLPEGAQQMSLVHGWVYLSKDPYTKNVKPAVGDFDGDGKDEIVTGKTANFGIGMGILLHEWDAGGAVVERNWANIPAVNQPGTLYWAIAAFDRRAGQDEVGVLAHQGFGKPWQITSLLYDPVADEWTQDSQLLGLNHNGELPALCSGDIDADGTEELQWGLWRGTELRRGYLQNGPNGLLADAADGLGVWQPDHQPSPGPGVR